MDEEAENWMERNLSQSIKDANGLQGKLIHFACDIVEFKENGVCLQVTFIYTLGLKSTPDLQGVSEYQSRKGRGD